MNKTAFLVLAVTMAAAGAGFAQTNALPFNPQDGETVVFLGDSITHQCLYTQYLEDFFITRYPERRIRFHNAGVSGDKAADALARFEADVAAYDPDYVTILLGMNDGHYEDYNAETFAAYQRGVTEVLGLVGALEAKPILLSPTMFDHAVVERRKDDETWRFRTRPFHPNYNALMAYYGGWVLEEAGRRRVPFVSLWAPLNTHTIEQRRTNRDFSLIEDAIHPQASGQMVMAFEILFQLGVERSSANGITLTKRGDRWMGRNVRSLETSPDGREIRFSHTAASLPWVIPAEEASLDLKWGLPSDGRIGYALTKTGHKLSADRVKIAGLEPGNYEISIDGQVIGTWNHIALGTKIEIQENEKTPQYQQALQVAILNQKRNDEAVRPLRDAWARIKILRKQEDAAVRLDEARAQANALSLQAQDMLAEIYEAAQPVERTWVIRKVD